MKKIWAAVRAWGRGDHLTPWEKIVTEITWVISVVALWFVSRHYHFGFMKTFFLLCFVPFVMAEAYSFIAIHDRKKKQVSQEQKDL